MTAQPDLFTDDGLTRRGGHATSEAAAERVRPLLSDLQRDVLIAIAARGPSGLTDRELEVLPQFAELAPSTARKRRSDLLHMMPPKVRALRDTAGKVVERNGLTVWVAI